MKKNDRFENIEGSMKDEHQQQLDELFQRWMMHEACAEGIFIPDGHVDEEAW
ncbi:hypothetical protein [Paenibacillus sp. Y412MC10]|uniref:hypothetical protein n=1 Tax=Geobacillus sp. (strain Y412MC10) TaxID=481743 RepID=UPI001642BF17|nr:hypothetical protein [Paenibacillus sp. Y412MC10]